MDEPLKIFFKKNGMLTQKRLNSACLQGLKSSLLDVTVGIQENQL